ncbi:MAG: co-chaperone GroES [Peptococcaceae bacterium]|nr:co-chaperone GroES [Peptococcaceae bacterium]
MNIKPLGEKVIIRPISAEQKTVGGIVLPDTAKEKPQQGEILAVGPGRVLDNGSRLPLEVKVGDKVLFSKYAAVDIKVDDEDLILLNERDIHAIL